MATSNDTAASNGATSGDGAASRDRTPRGRTVLVTGITGVVGTALLPELAGQHVIALTHSAAPPAGVIAVRGDLTRPRLGLPMARYRALARQVDVIVHAAAVTDFAAGATATAELNAGGTRRILDLAADAGATVHYVSTAFVARAGLSRTNVGDAVANPMDYLDSKQAAEQLVRESGLPATVLRPSVVIGDSRTGEISRFQGLHGLAAAVLRGALPLLPLDRTGLIDTIPADVLARAIAALIHGRVDSGEYWLTAGDAALTTGRLIDILVLVGERLGLPVTAPRLVRPDMVDRLIRPVFIDPLPAKVRRQFDDMMAMTALFCGPEPFPSSLDDLPGCRAPRPEELASAFAASVEYLVRAKGYLRRQVLA
jgi:nucleoside-diphosphate-sugar epimerase